MFESPIVSYSKRSKQQRALKYKYVSCVRRKYEQLNGLSDSDKQAHIDSACFPTPDNSAAEASDGDALEGDVDTAARRLKRKRLRLQSILGHATLDAEEGDLGSEEEDDLNGGSTAKDYEKQFFARYYKPEYTYELWATSPKNRVPIRRKMLSYQAFKQIENYSNQRMKATLSLSTKKAAAYHEVMRLGYETCPKEEVTNYQKLHLNHLVGLLYSNIISENWGTAYRCFALLIRMKSVDLRSIWNLGSHILSHLNFDMHEKFLEWMGTVFTSHSVFSQNKVNLIDPVFRSGSRAHTPNFMLAWLWLVLRGATADEVLDSTRSMAWLLEKVSELVLRPPYMDDAEIWFLYAMCYFIQADKLSAQLASHEGIKLHGSKLDIAKTQVTQYICSVKNCLESCREKGNFTYPERIIQEQLLEFERRLYAGTHKEQTDGNSFDTYESDTGEQNDNPTMVSETDFHDPNFRNFKPDVAEDDDTAFGELPTRFEVDSDYDSSE
ncbi:ACL020Wp [Eremothecium gossypii ATCC 10895]|uniref:ACL020Wp n=1 Tax=Eremothecium gossypii (strain ATCC 10895 / CBS 109.51 / FGSC 9923 / NRRL Y-1056) TaxID=284811 RepID=Q75CC9_EREGS|nr:ACL020Wp [Eremothecium gossypii ATCC 10895]AAS51208.2 ACL020Wp [Eremothecium gossypii ATCC 10895]AEY95499.1 FACL020Wp [Eremothecium gossypii FDAG1]